MDTVTKEKFKRDLIRNIGDTPKVYRDPDGFRVAGVGHILSKTDAEYNAPPGTPVSPQRVEAWLDQDANNAITETKKMMKGYKDLHPNLQRVLAALVYDIGVDYVKKRLKRFVEAVSQQNFDAIIHELRVSTWYSRRPEWANELMRFTREAKEDQLLKLRAKSVA